jgi:hypothetical protein
MRAVDAGAAMVERWVMKLLATIVMASLFALLTSASGTAQSASERATVGNTFAQSVPRRARTRLRVRPLYPYRRTHSLYPVPYDIEYPGPNGKRECVDRYVTEHRPSGTVIVPRMRCRWVRG